jgi:outer membrane protein TolC
MKSIINIFLLISIVLLGCSSYQKTDVTVNNRWSVSDRNLILSESNLPYLAWWQGFNDPLLNQLIESGMVNNNTLNMSRGHIEAAAGELKKIQFQWIPDINVLLGYSNNPATGFPGLLALLAPNYTLNVFSQIKQQKRAEYELAAAKAEDDSVKLTIISQISASYFTYQAELEHKELLQTLVEDINQLAKIANKLYAGGLSSVINFEELQSQVNLIQGEQEIVEQNLVVSRNALRYLINQNPGTLTPLRNFTQINNPGLIPGALPLTVLENRPDLQLAENELHASNEGIGLATSQLLPTLQLDFIGGPVAGNNSYHFPNPITTNVVDFNDELLKIPAFKMSTFGEIAKAKGLNKVSYYNYVDVLQKALRDTTNALSANTRLNNKLQQTTTATQHLSKAYALNQALYRQGILSVLDTLHSKIALDRIHIALNQDKLQQLLTVVKLYQELAGGYKVVESSNQLK